MKVLLLLFCSILSVLNSVQSSTKAIVDVTVIPMDSEEIIEHQTVIVEGDRISKIGLTSKVKIPRNAQIINGAGKFLIPGLMDMHTHFTKNDLPLFLSQGVTTIRNLNGNSTHLKLKQEVGEGLLDGPRIFTSGPLITGPKTFWKIKAVPNSPDSAIKIVRAQKIQGYDYIKIYEGLSGDTYNAIMDESKLLGIPVAVHIPELVSLEDVLRKKPASLEHVEKLVYTSFFGFKYEIEKIPVAAKMIKESNVWVCPTLASQEIFYLNRQGKFASMLNNPEMAYVDEGTFGWWKSIVSHNSGSNNDHQEGMSRFYPFLISITLGLHKAGVPLLAGTDSPNPGMIPGYSIHEELRNLVSAGLTPYEALKTTTTNGAKFLKMENEIGTIKEEAIADLVLLKNNPLEKITNTKEHDGIMVRGKWYTKNQLMELTEKVKRK